jgi:hypothetical protein
VKDLIIVGDSFCASNTGWPSQLAELLNLNLISEGFPGHHWWKAKRFLDKVDTSNAHAIIVVHTSATRIPTEDSQLVTFDHSQEPKNELELSVKLYNKYILNTDFLNWAQEKWIAELNSTFNNVYHLHSFPWSIPFASGNSITPNLCALSLNEIGAKEFALFHDNRPNHLSDENNTILAKQLYNAIANGSHTLDVSAFNLVTDCWFNWS